MNTQPFNVDFDLKQVAYTKVDAIKLDTKCLYAGKLERIKEWNEKPHSHPFCEIMFVLSGNGSVMVNDVEYGEFFLNAPQLNPNRKMITGKICGIRVEEIEEPLMQEIRYLDKLVDELAKGKTLEKILRK